MASYSASLKKSVPWWAKVAVKLALAKLAIDYRTLRSLSLSKHGGMDRPSWAFETFRRHFDSCDFARKTGPFVAMELGPGDSLFTAPLAKVHGASRTYLVDVGPFASDDLRIYRDLLDHLGERGYSVESLKNLDSVAAIMSACDADYSTRGLQSLREIPDGSVDFLFSNAVLQIVRRSELPATLKELRRIMRPDGIASHSIGIWDHINDELNHLRFSERVWESSFFSNSGFYSNRYRFSEFIKLFEDSGFRVNVTEVNRWEQLPISKTKLSPEFRNFSSDDLRVYSFNVLMYPN